MRDAVSLGAPNYGAFRAHFRRNHRRILKFNERQRLELTRAG